MEMIWELVNYVQRHILSYGHVPLPLLVTATFPLSIPVSSLMQGSNEVLLNLIGSGGTPGGFLFIDIIGKCFNITLIIP